MSEIFLQKTYIGEILKERMEALGFTPQTLGEESLTSQELVMDLLNNKLSIEQTNYIDIDFISQCLYCRPEYFTNTDARNKDIVYLALKDGQTNLKTRIVMAKIQRCMEDFEFLLRIHNETQKDTKNSN